jgi:hypothetical protein
MGSWLVQVTVLALGCKVAHIYAEDVHTQAAFGITSLLLLFSGCHYKCQACQIKSKRFLFKGQGCDCLRKLIVGTSLSLSKISDTLSSETCNSQNIVVFHHPPTQSHDCNQSSLRKKMQSISRSVVAVSQSYDATDVGLEGVRVFVT